MSELSTLKFETSSDRFLDLSLEAQLLYFHMAMSATDFGQVYNARAIGRALEIDMTIPIAELLDNMLIMEGYKADGKAYPNFYNISVFLDDDGE